MKLNPLFKFFNLSKQDSVSKENIARALKKSIEDEYYPLKHDIKTKWGHVDNNNEAKKDMFRWLGELKLMLDQVNEIVNDINDIDIQKSREYREKRFKKSNDDKKKEEEFWKSFERMAG